MKKFFIFTTLVVVFSLVSCSSIDESSSYLYDDNFQQESAEIIEELKQLNDRFVASSESYCSRGLRGLALFSADFIGAYEGSKAGGAIGGAIGSAFAGAGAAPGAAAGAIIGGAICGIGASYGMWCTTRGCGGMEYPSIWNISEAYCEIKSEMISNKFVEDSVAFVGLLDIPESAGLVEEIGIIHNAALDKLIYSGSLDIMSLENHLTTPDVEVVSNCYELPPLEMSILHTDEFETHYESHMTSICNGGYLFTIDSDSFIPDQIVKLYIDTVENMNNLNLESVIDFTNQYISVISNSNELMDVDGMVSAHGHQIV